MSHRLCRKTEGEVPTQIQWGFRELGRESRGVSVNGQARWLFRPDLVAEKSPGETTRPLKGSLPAALFSPTRPAPPPMKLHSQAPGQSIRDAPLEVEPEIPALRAPSRSWSSILAPPALGASALVHFGVPTLLSMPSFGGRGEFSWLGSWLECIQDTGWRSTLAIFLGLVALRM